MGSPVSAIIANLVMQFIEEKAIETAQTRPKWWYRFVDDSHSCLRRQDIHSFLAHLNSINPHINFTMETENDGCLPFLDTLTKRERNKVTVEVFRKPTHTNKYLDFNSCHPIQHKRSVVRTLLDRAKKIPSTSLGKTNEAKYIHAVLKENGYTTGFQNSCRRQTNSNPQPTTTPNGNDDFFTTLPYIQGVSEKLGRILRKEGLKVAYKPMRVLSNIFTKPKDKRDKEQTTGVVYKLPCKDCDFVYYGQTQRSLKTRSKEHQKACFENDRNSKVAQHANKESHSFDFTAIAIIDKEKDWRKRIFLEAWHSLSDPKAGNEHKQIPSMYKSLMTSV